MSKDPSDEIVPWLLPSPWPLTPLGSPNPPVCICSEGWYLGNEGFSLVEANVPICTWGASFGRDTGAFVTTGALASISTLGGSTRAGRITGENLEMTSLATTVGSYALIFGSGLIGKVSVDTRGV